jgi:L-cysteine:1D-myo-inositol 2-amino-2-deoxy-alpha-D-glucopyranoside ligase
LGSGSAGEAAAGEVRRLLAADLDVPAALSVALAEGGAAARLLIATLGLD